MNRICTWLIVAAVTVACDGTPDIMRSGEPQPGRLSVSLLTPHTDDAAIVIEISGTGIANLVAADPAYWLLADQVDETTVRAIVAGELAGTLVTFDVPDVGAAALYTASVIQVADHMNRPRETLEGYALDIAR
jgi:hypothetical protein